MPIYSLEDLVFALISEIGLGITPDGFLFDQDSQIVILYNGLQIKASVNSKAPAIATDIYAAFDPIFDPKLMQMMFGYYAHKCEMTGYKTVVAVTEATEDHPKYLDFDIRSKRTMLSVTMEDFSVCNTLYYYQKGLKYSDAILRMGGSPYADLTKFDSIPEESIVVY